MLHTSRSSHKWSPWTNIDRWSEPRAMGHPLPPSPSSRGSSAFSYPMSPAGWLPLDLNGESPVQRTASPQSSLKASRSTRRAVRFRRGALLLLLLLLDPLQSDQLVTVENATQSAGAACPVSRVGGRARGHYAWPPVGPLAGGSKCSRSASIRCPARLTPPYENLPRAGPTGR